MSTRYSVDVFYNGEWNPIAIFSNEASPVAIEAFCLEQFDNGNSLLAPAENIRAVDLDTGEVIFDWQEQVPAVYNDEPADIDDDCGFDPYLGCYTEDC